MTTGERSLDRGRNPIPMNVDRASADSRAHWIALGAATAAGEEWNTEVSSVGFTHSTGRNGLWPTCEALCGPHIKPLFGCPNNVFQGAFSEILAGQQSLC